MFSALLIGAFLCIFSAGDRLAHLPGHAGSRLSPSWFGAGNAQDNALRAIDQNDFRAALHWASVGVARDPIGEHSTSLLALALLGTGQNAAAQQAYTVAAMTGWRDAGVQIYWLMAGLQVGDLTVAAQRADALLRAGNRDAQTLTGVSMLESTPGGRSALAERLSLSPNWTSWYLLSLEDLQPPALANRIAVIATASRHGLRLDRRQASRAATALRVNGQIRSAIALWRLLGGPSNTGQVIEDGGFEHKTSDRASGPFEWALIASGDIDVRVDENSPLRSGGALYVQSSATATRRIAQQALALAAGAYLIHWRSADAGGERSNHLDVRVLCEGSIPTTAEGTVPTAIGRDQSTLAFNVPETGCDSQLVVINWHPGAVPSSSPVWIDDISIARS
ncbi:MAG: hypothetical protein ACTHM8_11870 [Sphingomonas sp.]